MKVLKAIGFFILALLVFAGFAYPFSSVPARHEAKAREMTEARIESGSLAVDQSYVDQSVREAVTSNLDSIFRTAFILAAAVAALIFFISLRPPHDCGGINWFNPIALVFVAAIPLAMSAVICLALKAYPSQAVTEFGIFVEKLSSGLTFEKFGLFALLFVPVVLEVVFRGFIFSYLERIHPIVAIVLCPVLYALAAYFIVYNYMSRSVVSTAAAGCALFTALGVGLVHSVMTWRLRSLIPAVLSHLIMAFSASRVAAFCDKGSLSLPAAAVILGVLIAAFIAVFTFGAKKFPFLAYDFPFAKHHKAMYDRLYATGPIALPKFGGRKKASEKKENKETAAVVPAEEKKAKKTSAKLGNILNGIKLPGAKRTNKR
ncbi:MAG: CPBP family intramembrane metalloprotease [Clostridia bacterium]|nr:CPBP family intramembrane metalloprotease [Clostridia bacterium]